MVILLVGGVIRGLYLSEMTHAPDFTYPGVDAAYHDYWARSLVTGDWSRYAPFPDPHIQSMPFFRPPGYPYFLALIYMLTHGSYVAARIVQMALGLLNCFLGYKLARRWFGSAAGLIAAALMSAYWVFIYYEGEFLEPVLLIGLGLALVHQLSLLTEKVTLPRSLIAGVLMGLFALCRPNILLFGAAALIWLWWIAKDRRLALRSSVALILGTAVTIAPATIRNYVVAHDFVPISSNMGINLFIGNNESANGLCAFEIADLGGAGTCYDYPALVDNIGKKLGGPVKYSEASSYLAHRATEYIKTHPMETLGLMVRKAEYFWSPIEVGHNEEDEMERINSRVLRWVPGRFALILGFGLIGAALLSANTRRNKDASVQRQRAVLVLIGLFIIAYSVSFLPFFSAGQYRIPIVPFLMLFAAYGISRIGQLAMSRNYIPAACWLIAGAGAFGLASMNLTGYQPDASKWHYDRAVSFDQLGKPALAIEEYEEAIRVKPRLFQAHCNLGLLLVDAGRTDEAMRHFREALAIHPKDEWSYYGMGLVYERQGKLKDASAQFKKAISLFPYHFMAHHEVGLLALAQGDISAAISHFQAALQIEPQFNPSRVALATLRYNLGVALDKQNKHDEAIRQYREAVHIQPEYAKAHKNLAVALYFKGDYAGAWAEIKLNRKYGGTPHPEFVKALEEKMAEP